MICYPIQLHCSDFHDERNESVALPVIRVRLTGGGEGANPRGGSASLLFFTFFAINCMKMKGIGLKGECFLASATDF